MGSVKDVADLVHKLQGFAEAYEFFSPVTEDERAWLHKERPGLQDRIAADMGRHMAKFTTEAASQLTAVAAERDALAAMTQRLVAAGNEDVALMREMGGTITSAQDRAITAERLLAEARAILSDFVTNYADMQDGDGNEAPELARARSALSPGGSNGQG